MIIAANWKMNLTHEEALALCTSYSDMMQKTIKQDIEIIVFPPAIYAPMVEKAGLFWGGQCCHNAVSGAHTGDISAAMFASAGATWQLVGHSERRIDHKESDDDIAAQLQAGQAAGLKVVLCVGEQLEEREDGRAAAVVTAQLERAMAEQIDWQNLVIAYEPVWAIGTGRVAAPSDVEEMHKHISEICVAHLGAPQRPAILYGGSVKAANATELFALAHVDGALVGGASLIAEEFAGIISTA